ncbi:hypothetical protein KAT92_04770 [Candidatus Babeliales bacterium]|nr:hypothetical protein [Candidatus Babeliales bacterium]
MALSEQKILAIKIDYELGKLSKTSICKKHRISRPTLRKHANDGDWIYQKSFKEVSEKVERKVIERLVDENVDIVSETTERFLKDSANIRGVTVAVAKSMVKLLKESSGNLSASEANRLLACQKVSETAARTITSLYNFERKALGMDSDKEKGSEQTQEEKSNSLLNRLKTFGR